MKKAVLTNLSLPAFAFLDADELQGRNVILHIRSASVVEVLEDKPGLRLDPDAVTKRFVYKSPYGHTEKMVCVLHHAPLLEQAEATEEEIIDIVIDPAIDYYIADCAKMDLAAIDEIDNSQN